MTEQTIPARPTTYRGIKMRSRLEATYAAGLDELHVDWAYEPRAFAGRRGQYLPDFYVHADGKDIYIEVKPTLAYAQAILPRMQVIHESLPTAYLSVWVRGAGYFLLEPGQDVWRWNAV